MKAFTALYTALDETNRTNEKIEALTRYFRSTEPADAVWALYFLIGRRPRATISATKLSTWAIEAAGIPEWLFGECYDAVGDFAESVALLLPENSVPLADDVLPFTSLHDWIEQVLLPLRTIDEMQQRTIILSAWRRLTAQERFVWNKLITGGFRVGVSQRLVIRALAAVSDVDDTTISHRLMGDWEPNTAFYAQLIGQETSDADVSRPYPSFCLSLRGPACQ
jgi:DNA ligase 1